jgi:hypothetical protein
MNSDDDDEEEKQAGRVEWKRRPVERGKTCRTCLNACWLGMLNTPIGPIAVVSLLVATGLMAAIWAMVNSGPYWHLPLYNTLCSLIPLIPLFCLGGVNEIERIAVNGMRDEDTFRVDEQQYAFAWFLMGACLIIPFGSPVLLGQMAAIPPHLVWISAVGSWCLVASIILGVAFTIRLSYHTPSTGSV